MTAHFTNLPAILIRHLSEARTSIRIAVCWFSNPGIFEVILEQLRAGVQVELVLEYDAQNFRPGGLDFRRFVRLGGMLYGYRSAELMHHKFAVLDSETVLTGSFNWTNSSNAENLLVVKDAGLASGYLEELSRLKALSPRILKIRRDQLKPFAAYPLFENTRFRLEDVRLRISLGAGVWVVPSDYPGLDRERPWQSVCLNFDPDGVLLPYWGQERSYHLQRMQMYLKALDMDADTLRRLRVPALRMRKGDFILLRHGAMEVLGILQSDPQPSRSSGFSCAREVQWLQLMEGRHIAKAKQGQYIKQYQGNRMALVDGFYNLPASAQD